MYSLKKPHNSNVRPGENRPSERISKSKTDVEEAQKQRAESPLVLLALVVIVVALGGASGWFARTRIDAIRATKTAPVVKSLGHAALALTASAEFNDFEDKVNIAEQRRERDFDASIEATSEALEEAEEMEKKLEKKKTEKKKKKEKKNGARGVNVADAAASSHVSAVAAAAAPADDSATPEADSHFYHHGYNINGNDLDMLKTDSKEPSSCCMACTDFKGCKGWTFVPGTRKCFLKSESDPLEKAPKHAWVSGRSDHCPVKAAPPAFHNLPVADMSRPARPFLIVTAASNNHLCAVQQLLSSLALYEGNTKVLVYDLNWQATLDPKWLLKFNQNVLATRWFNYSAYPPWFNNRMHYSWKVGIMKEAMEKYGDDYGGILWMDAGNAVTSKEGLDTVEAQLQKEGFVSGTSSGSIEKYTHAGMFAHYGMDKEEMKANDKRVTVGRGLMCNGALVGFKKDTPAYKKIFMPWVDCAWTKQCIAPKGSDRTNHRQDQSALSLLVSVMNDKQFQCTPGLVKGGLLTQQDHQALRTCIKPPPGKMDMKDCSHDGHECVEKERKR